MPTQGSMRTIDQQIILCSARCRNKPVEKDTIHALLPISLLFSAVIHATAPAQEAPPVSWKDTVVTHTDTLYQTHLIIENATQIDRLGYRVPKFRRTRSLLSGEYSSSRSGPLTFLINQGLTVVQGDSIWPFSAPWFLRGNYQGAYDFNMLQSSGPIISRLQNPSLFLQVDWLKHDLGLMAGWAHESNGQHLNSDSGARMFEQISGDAKGPLSAQDFASMGWDYWWFRLEKAHSWGGYSLEYRHHVRQLSGFRRSGIEDTSFFDDERHPRIMDVDGIRLSVSYTKLPWNNGKLSLYATLPEVWNHLSFGEYIDVTKYPMSIEHIHENRYIPWFVSFAWGRMTSLARFTDENQWKANIGVIVPPFYNQGL
jgi:hypothetical protein